MADGAIDIASLGVKFDTTQVAKGTAEFDANVAAGAAMEAQTKEVANALIILVNAARQAMQATMGTTAAVAEESKAVSDLERRLTALRSSIDPTYAAQKRLDAEIKEATALYRMGAIEAAEYATAIRVLEERQRAATLGAAAMNTAHGRVIGSSKALQGATLNLSRQFADIGVSAAMGINPLMILIQQGPQIADAFALAKTQGLGFMGVMRGMGAAIAPFLPILAAVAAVVGVVAAGFGLLHRELSKGYPKDITDGLGLTEQQLERVKHKSVTFGDTIMATFTVIGRHIMAGPVGKALDWLGDRFGEVMDWITKTAVDAFAKVFSVSAATVLTIAQNWQKLPAILGDAFAGAVNLAIDGIELMVNAAIAGLNAVIALANKVPGVNIGSAGGVKLGRMSQSGAAADFASDFKRNEAIANKGIRAAGSAFFDEIGDEAISRARKRALDEAGKPGKGRNPRDKQSDEEKEYERILKASRELTAQYEQEAASQKKLNDAVAAGTITSAEAVRQYELEKLLRPILAEADKVEGAQKKELLDLVQRLTVAYNALGQEKVRADILKANEANAEVLGQIKAEIDLIGVDTATRAQRLAVMRAEQELKAKGYNPETADAATKDAAEKFVEGRKAQAAATVDLQQKTDAYNDSLVVQLDLLAQIDQQARDAANGLGDLFGNAGKALGNLLVLSTSYASKQAEIAHAEAEYRKQVGAANVDEKRIAVFRKQAANEQVEHYGEMIGAAKGFFKEGSQGWKAMQAAETVYRVYQFAMAVQAIALKGAESAATAANAGVSIASDAATTVSTVATSAIKATAHGVVAVARAIASLPFPLNLAAGAATAAALVAYGVKLVGGGGGGGGGVNIAEERQKVQGTGTVLGDSKAKSESIANALKIVASNTNRDLEYSNAMLRALNSIDTNIGALTSELAKQLNVGGSLDTGRLNLGTTYNPGILGKIPLIGGLFGTTKTTTLLDQGLQFAPQSLDSILGGGIQGSTYQTTQTTKKKKFFGITSTKTSTNTDTDALDSGVQAELQRVVASLREGVLAAASTLGLEGANAALSAFTVDLGTISFKDKTGEEIQQELEAVFSKLGDEMAVTAAPVIAQLQQVGEGAFETLARVAREYQVVDVALASIGKSFGAVGVASLAARDDLVQLFGSLDDFAAATQAFADDFLTEAERMAPIQKAVQDELARLGVTGVNTKAEFKALVQSLDLTTQAGRDMYASLLAVGPAFAKVADYIAEGSEEINKARDALSAAYERESDALLGTIDTFRQFSASLAEFRESLYTGPSALLSPEAQYEAAKSKFEDVAARAALGDEGALKDLQSVSQAYLDASRAYYASSGRYFADLAAVRDAVERAEATATRTADNATQQLDALKASVAGLIKIDEDVISVHDAILNLTALLSAQAANSNATPFSPASPTGTPGYTYTATEATTQPYTAPVAANDPVSNDSMSPGFVNPQDIVDGFFSGRMPDIPNGGARRGYYAKGGAFGPGGIVTRPTAFQTGQGSGVAGEAGTEGVLPLANIGGRLGVYASTGSDPELKALLVKLIALIEQGNADALRVGEALLNGDDANTAKLARVIDDASTTSRLTSGGLAA